MTRSQNPCCSKGPWEVCGERSHAKAGSAYKVRPGCSGFCQCEVWSSPITTVGKTEPNRVTNRLEQRELKAIGNHLSLTHLFSSLWALQGNMGCSQPVTVVPATHGHSQPSSTWVPRSFRNVVVPERIPRGLPSACSSPSAAPARLHTRGPPFRHRSGAVPGGGSSPGPSAAPRAALLGPEPSACRVSPGRIRCGTGSSSVAVRGDGLRATPAGCRGTACSTTGLCWAAGSCCSARGAPPLALTRCCRAASLWLLGPLSQLLSHSSVSSLNSALILLSAWRRIKLNSQTWA